MLDSQKYLQIIRTVDEGDLKLFNDLNSQIEESFSSLTIADCYIQQVMRIVHDAYGIDNIKFIKEIFFESTVTLRKTELHRKRIINEINKLDKLEGEEYAVNAVNIYRSIIADLFDPYMSILVACVQFYHGSFVSYINSNLGYGERNKYEYVVSKCSKLTILQGYNPLVRNAISHTGTDSVEYEKEAIIFRNIKRGDTLKIEYVRWTMAELSAHISYLTDFIFSVDAAMNIFGIDVKEVIGNSQELKQAFLDIILSPEERLKVQQGFFDLISKIEASPASDREKFEILSNMFLMECSKREMRVLSIKAKAQEKIIFIVLPETQNHYEIGDELLPAIISLLRYGIIAEPFFRKEYESFIVIEENKNLEAHMSQKDLFDYGIEQAGIVDLLNDSRFFLNRIPVVPEVDFDKIREIEYESIGRKFPRKKR